MNRADTSLTQEYLEQFRLRRMSIFDWGTFSGLHSFDVAESGILLLGPSGAGKSTILDAHAALMTPPKWVSFNLAARENAQTHRDRTLVSYVRGEYGDRTNESGEEVAQLLRPGTTWSAVTETYRNRLGKVVSLVLVLWLRGTQSETKDVHRLYMVAEREFNLRELEFFPGVNFDVRKLRATLAGVIVRDDFSGYYERFRHHFAMGPEHQALRLLHKTLSTKNLENLNTFLRSNMLDDPKTIDIAAALVEEFAELNAAHSSVVDARRQVELLKPARAAYDASREAHKRSGELGEAIAGADQYVLLERERLLQERLDELDVRISECTASANTADAELHFAIRARQDLEDRHREQGGSRIQSLEAELQQAISARDERVRRRDQFAGHCAAVGVSVPDQAGGFTELQVRARREVDQASAAANDREDQRYRLKAQSDTASVRFVELRREIEAMQRQPSNIPSRMLDLREAIARGISVVETQLPFVGELLQVRHEDAEWQGAIERVLHNFALSLLVDERHYRAVSDFVDGHNLGARLVYYRTSAPLRGNAGQPGANSIIRKLQIAKRPEADWLRNELAARFDYACCASTDELRRSPRGVTRAGQIRHGERQHEKDDRFAIQDRQRWVLGFDNTAKLEVFRREAQQLAERIEALRRALTEAQAHEDQCRIAIMHYTGLLQFSWADVDVAAAVQRVVELEKAIARERAARPNLAALAEAIKDARVRCEALAARARDAQSELALHRRDRAAFQDRLRASQEELKVDLTPVQQSILSAEFGQRSRLISLENIDRMLNSVTQALQTAQSQSREAALRSENDAVVAFTKFNMEWPAEAAGLDANIRSAEDYFGKLDRLVRDGLPEFERRFRELLRKQSDENLTRLATALKQERKSIQERLELVNESLYGNDFNPGTFLEIESRDLNLPAVREFLQDLRQAFSHSLGGDPAEEEGRFKELQRVVARLASQDAADRAWRAVVLDVRQHVEFIAHEFERDGRREIEVYRGGAGKSGGQRQKLAATVLAAALRYQLAGEANTLPRYATIMLDEGFDRADANFTAACMQIFRAFGFQMIIATPLKQVMTFEPFVGGGVLVQIRERKISRLREIAYDEVTERLDCSDVPEQEEAI